MLRGLRGAVFYAGVFLSRVRGFHSADGAAVGKSFGISDGSLFCCVAMGVREVQDFAG
jgi:hypothetical protein